MIYPREESFGEINKNNKTFLKLVLAILKTVCYNVKRTFLERSNCCEG